MTKMEESEMPGEEIDSSSLENHNIIKTEANDLHSMSIDFSNPEVTTSITESTSVPLKCAACKKVIVDKYYLHLDNKCWHENCVRCNVCGVALYDSCFLKNRKLFCKEDYDKLRKQCKGCHENLTDTDRVLVLKNSTYHVSCFACEFCRRQLQRGDQYLLLTEDKESVCCKQCYDSESRVTIYADDSGSDQSLRDDDVFSPGVPPRSLGTPGISSHYHHTSPLSGYPSIHRHLSASEKGSQHSLQGHPGICQDKRSKRPRTILTTAQRRKFKASFEISQKPCRKVRETLAAETGLSPRVVQVWFQNQRAKMKKIARRQNQGDGSERGRGKNRKRKDGDSDSENDCSSPGSYSSTPTPRLYNEMYTSPGSMQTSPTPKHDIGGEFLSPLQQPSVSMDSMYDDFGSGMSTSPYLSTPNGSMTSGTSTVTLQNLEHVSPSMPSSHRPLNLGYDSNSLRGNVAMRVDDSAGTSCNLNHSLTQFMNNRAPSSPTPIEDLIHMQSNFFRT